MKCDRDHAGGGGVDGGGVVGSGGVDGGGVIVASFPGSVLRGSDRIYSR